MAPGDRRRHGCGRCTGLLSPSALLVPKLPAQAVHFPEGPRDQAQDDAHVEKKPVSFHEPKCSVETEHGDSGKFGLLSHMEPRPAECLLGYASGDIRTTVYLSRFL